MPESQSRVRFAIKIDIAVIGAGQAGLSAAYHLMRLGLQPGRSFIVLDRNPKPGGAWQHRWPSLTLSTVNRLHDLPGMAFSEALDGRHPEVKASVAVPDYFAAYEDRFRLPVYRPVTVKLVCERHDRFRIETNREAFAARGLINATGTWETPHIPAYPGADRFRGRQLHTRDYRTGDEFVGRHVIVVGGGISALQHLDEISQLTTTTWVTRREPRFREGPFTLEDGRIPQLARSSGTVATARGHWRHRHGGAPRHPGRQGSANPSRGLRAFGVDHRRQPRRGRRGKGTHDSSRSALI